MIEVTPADPAATAPAEPARPYMPTKAASEDWNTPPDVLDVVTRIFGGTIDLDPCSNPWSVVGARREVMLPKWQDAWRERPPSSTAGLRSVEWGDGIRTVWGGNVFVNPPYAAGPLGEFMARSVRAAKSEEQASVVMLAPSKTDIKGWHRAVPKAAALCFLQGRVDFLVPGGSSACGTSAPAPSALILWTHDRELVHRFSWYLDGKLGHVMSPR